MLILLLMLCLCDYVIETIALSNSSSISVYRLSRHLHIGVFYKLPFSNVCEMNECAGEAVARSGGRDDKGRRTTSVTTGLSSSTKRAANSRDGGVLGLSHEKMLLVRQKKDEIEKVFFLKFVVFMFMCSE
jgi:hypothetical protein